MAAVLCFRSEPTRAANELQPIERLWLGGASGPADPAGPGDTPNSPVAPFTDLQPTRGGDIRDSFVFPCNQILVRFVIF